LVLAGGDAAGSGVSPGAVDQPLTPFLPATVFGPGPLAADGETSAMTLAAVGADVPQTLHVLLDLATQGAFDHETTVDDGADRTQLLVVELARKGVRFDPGLLQDVGGELRADAVDVLQGVQDLLLFGDVDAGDAGHGDAPLGIQP
jgi:hypothetical protein